MFKLSRENVEVLINLPMQHRRSFLDIEKPVVVSDTTGRQFVAHLSSPNDLACISIMARIDRTHVPHQMPEELKGASSGCISISEDHNLITIRKISLQDFFVKYNLLGPYSKKTNTAKDLHSVEVKWAVTKEGHDCNTDITYLLLCLDNVYSVHVLRSYLYSALFDLTLSEKDVATLFTLVDSEIDRLILAHKMSDDNQMVFEKEVGNFYVGFAKKLSKPAENNATRIEVRLSHVFPSHQSYHIFVKWTGGSR